MQIDLSNKNNAVYQLVKMLHSEHKPILFTGFATERKEAFIKELRTHFPVRVTLNGTTIPKVLPETVKLIIVENVTDTKTLYKWYKLCFTGIPSDKDPDRIIFPYIVIDASIDKNKFKSLSQELLNSFKIIELN